MKDREIRQRRSQLNDKHKKIVEEWEAYDARYPVEVGAYKPADYDRRQIRFVERLGEVRKELSQLPSTKARKIGLILVVVALLVSSALLVRYLFW